MIRDEIWTRRKLNYTSPQTRQRCRMTHGLSPIKMHCSVLAEDAIKEAVADYYKKSGQDNVLKEVSHQHQMHEEKELLSRNK